MNVSSRKLLATAVAAGMCVSTSAWATNGYFAHGYGTATKSLAGAGAAFPTSSLASATNPAGLVHLGDRMDVGLAFFSPSDRGFTADSVEGIPDDMLGIPPGVYTSDNDVFLIPHFGWTHMLDDRSALGIAVYGNGGMNTEYDTAVFARFDRTGNFPASSPTGIDLVQLFVNLSYSFKVTERHAVGIGPILAIQSFEAEGLEPFQAFSVSPDNVTNNGHDESYGVGAKIGWQGDFTDWLSAGASYRSKVYMTKFDDYEGLFAEQGDFDIPADLTIGIALRPIPQVAVVFDWQKIYYGDVASLNNTNNTAIVQTTLMGSDDGLGFGWDDQEIWKLGVQWDVNPTWTLRAGYSSGDEPFTGEQGLFNVLAPAVIKEHWTAGLTWRFNKQNEINVSYMYAPENEVEGQNESLTGPQTGSVWMEQQELEISWGVVF